MTLVTPTITKALLSMIVTQQSLTPNTDIRKIAFPINFGTLSYLKTFTGTFTPSNNTSVIVNSGIPSNADDYFILFMCDGQANLSVTAVLETPYLPLTKILCFTLKGDSSNQISAITIDGRTSVPDPMAQGVPVNYTLVLARGSIT